MDFFNKQKSKSNQQKAESVNSIQKYLTNVDEGFIDINHYIQADDKCDKKINGRLCNGELISVEHEGVRICNKCGIRTAFLVAHEKPSYKEPPKEVCFYAYKRINHFREILAQFQAKETTQIPPEVLNNIKAQIKKERITVRDLSNKKAKDILKKLGYNKYYEHIPFIKDKLGIKPPIMHPELEERLCNLFLEIQKPYAKHCPDGRVNFLNYYYVLYKTDSCTDCTNIKNVFKDNQDKTKLYLVDMSDGINQMYIYDWDNHDKEYGTDDKEAKYNTTPTDATELEIAYYPTLVHITQGKVVEFIDREVLEYVEALFTEEGNE